MRQFHLLFTLLTLVATGNAAVPPASPSLSGSVHDDRGAALRDVRVELIPLPARSHPEPTVVTRSDSAGHFTVIAPRAGLWQVGITAPGFVPLRSMPVVLNRKIEMPKAVLSRDVGIRITLRDRLGQPLAGARVMVRGRARESEQGFGAGWRIAPRLGRGDAQGQLVLPRRRGETLHARAFLPGSVVLTHTIGTTEADLSLALDPGARRIIEVRGAEGEPLAGIQVDLGLVGWPAGETDAEGRLVLHGRLNGLTPIHLSSAAGRFSSGLLLPRPESEPPPDQFNLAPPRRVAGQILDGRNQKPLAGVFIRADHDTGRSFSPVASLAVSDTAGRFGPLGLYPEQPYDLLISQAGFRPITVRVEATGAPEITVHLEKNRPAYGRVLGLEDHPITGAEVILRRSKAEPTQMTEPIASSWSEPVETNSLGRFEIPDLPAAVVDIRARGRGFAPLVIPGVRVSPGEGPADFGILRLEQGQTVTGRVSDTAGSPLAGAAIWIAEDQALASHNVREKALRRKPDLKTEPDGSFAVRDLPAGRRIYLFFRHEGYLPASAMGVEAPREEPLRVVLNRASGRLRGWVLDEDGEPVVGAQVHLRGFLAGFGRIEPWKQGALQEVSVVTGRRGDFELSELAPGSAVLEITADGFRPEPPREFEIPADEPRNDLEIVLQRGAVLEGTITDGEGEAIVGARIRASGISATSGTEGVYRLAGLAIGPSRVEVLHSGYATASRTLDIAPGVGTSDFVLVGGHRIAGHVVDSAGTVIAGVRMLLRRRDHGPGSHEALSGTDGEFVFPTVTAGQYVFMAEKQGYAPLLSDDDFLVGDEPLEALEVILQPATVLRGSLLGLAARELAAVQVWAENSQATRRGTVRRGTVRQGTVTSDKRYVITDLGVGDWVIHARFPDGRRHAEARAVIEPGVREVVRDLEFGAGLVFSGQVFHRGEPVSDTRVTLTGHDLDLSRSVLTDLAGGFAFEDLEPSSYRIGVANPRQALLHNEDIELFTDRDIRIEIATARLGGRVLSAATSRPLPETIVSLQQLVAGVGSSIVAVGTGPEGTFLLDRISAGPHRLLVRQAGYSQVEREIEVHAGADLEDLELQLEPAEGLDVSVRLASGGVPRAATVSAFDPAGNVIAFDGAQLTADGFGRWSTLPAGTWELFITAPGAAAFRTRASVPGVLAVELPAAGRLHVRVPALAETRHITTVTAVDLDGHPLPALDQSGALRSAWSFVAGTGTIEQIPEGLWRVKAATNDGRAWEGLVAVVAGVRSELTLE